MNNKFFDSVWQIAKCVERLSTGAADLETKGAVLFLQRLEGLRISHCTGQLPMQ
jgi:hypothetical protein